VTVKLAGEKWPWPEIALGTWKRLGNQRSRKIGQLWMLITQCISKLRQQTIYCWRGLD